MNKSTLSDNSQRQSFIHPKTSQEFFRQLDLQLLIHELKGPLSVIESNNRMLLELQHRYGRLNESQERAIKRSLHCAAKLENIIQSLLEVGNSANICRFDVVDLTKEILVDLLETEVSRPIEKPDGAEQAVYQRCQYLSANGIFLDMSPEVEGLFLRQDKAKLVHILNNLVRNALQHKKSRVIVHLAINKPYLEIRVHDDGHGIPPVDQPKLFTCYTQMKAGQKPVRAKGHGLGLACSRILARRLGGDITVDAQCRSGCCFVLQLPLDVEQL